MSPFAKDAGFAELFTCTKNSDCEMTCVGAVSASFVKRSGLVCADGCLLWGSRAICQNGVCVAPSDARRGDGRPCSPGLFADASMECPPPEDRQAPARR